MATFNAGTARMRKTVHLVSSKDHGLGHPPKQCSSIFYWNHVLCFPPPLYLYHLKPLNSDISFVPSLTLYVSICDWVASHFDVCAAEYSKVWVTSHYCIASTTLPGLFLLKLVMKYQTWRFTSQATFTQSHRWGYIQEARECFKPNKDTLVSSLSISLSSYQHERVVTRSVPAMVVSRKNGVKWGDSFLWFGGQAREKTPLKETNACGSNSRSYTSASSLEDSENGDDLHEMLAAEQSEKPVVGLTDGKCEVLILCENGPMQLSLGHCWRQVVTSHSFQWRLSYKVTAVTWWRSLLGLQHPFASHRIHAHNWEWRMSVLVMVYPPTPWVGVNPKMFWEYSFQISHEGNSLNSFCRLQWERLKNSAPVFRSPSGARNCTVGGLFFADPELQALVPR